MILAHHITTPSTAHLCRRCGITLNEGRSYPYDYTAYEPGDNYKKETWLWTGGGVHYAAEV